MEDKEFRHIVLPLQERLYALGVRLGLPPDEAADALQDTLLRLWRGRGGLPPDRREAIAYCTIAYRNTCLTQLKRMLRTVSLEDADFTEVYSESSSFEEKEFREGIGMLIGRLPNNQRIVVRLNLFGELGIEEIAEVTGYSSANVRQLLSRGRKRLREMMAQSKDKPTS